jgi:hypothetical protein
LTAGTYGLLSGERRVTHQRLSAFKGKERRTMDRMKEDRSRSENVTSETPSRGRSNPYTNRRMPLEHEEKRKHEDVEDNEEE